MNKKVNNIINTFESSIGMAFYFILFTLIYIYQHEKILFKMKRLIDEK